MKITTRTDGQPRLWRSRWAAIGAAVAVTLGAGGLATVGAGTTQSVFVPVSPQRVLDTRINLGLSGPMVSTQNRTLDVTGTIQIVATGDRKTTASIVPDGATAIVANLTAVGATDRGYVSIRPGDVTGVPSTSNLNITSPGGVFPNSVTVQLPTSGSQAGRVGLYFASPQSGATTHLLLDIVGYYVAGSGVPGPEGPQGPKGPTGATGATGPRGPAAWETIPSGTTIIGPLNFDSVQASDGSSDEYYVPLGGVAPVALTDANVNFAPPSDGGSAFGDQNTGCTGTVDTPTAPAGKVCIYVRYAGGVDRASTAGWAPFFQPDRGFNIGINPSGTAGGDMYLFGSWAYTAP